MKYALYFYLFFIFVLIQMTVTNSLNVLFVTNKFPYEFRPYIDNQIAVFIDSGIKVNVLAFYHSQHEKYFLSEKYNFKKFTYYEELPKENSSFDIIYCQFPGVAKKMLKLRRESLVSGKVVVCFRAGNEFVDIQKNITMYQDFFREVDLIFVVCKAFKEKLLSYGCPKEKIIVNYSAIAPEHFPLKERVYRREEIKLITIGRLHKMKGYHILIDAIAKIKMDRPDLKLTCSIFGEGEEYDILQKQIHEKNLQHIVFLRGFTAHELVVDQLYAHDIFISTSYSTDNGDTEGIPNVLMEAMVTQCPVIATQHSGIPELVEHNISGLLVPEKNSNALKDAIIYFADNVDLWKKYGRCGRRKVLEQHNIYFQAINTLKILELLSIKDTKQNKI